MNQFLDLDLLNLNDCGCCDGIAEQTPIEIFNRAGLSEISYRVGIHDQFKQSMLAQLSSTELIALQNLTTRDDDDFAIALLDAWATVADVLTFYQERIAQESYLRTATERFSIRQLARLIGYQLRPGVAASTQLAFTLDTAPGSPQQITIDAGTKVQSIPGKDEQPQMFETSTAIEARTAWNDLRPRLTQPQTSESIETSITVQGIATNITPGDKLLIVKDSTSSIKTVYRVEVNQTENTTQLDLAEESTTPPPFNPPLATDIKVPDNLLGLAENEIIGKIWVQEDLLALAETQDWSLDELTDNVMTQLANPSSPAEVFVFRQQASIFGYNAAKRVMYSKIGSGSSNPGGTLTTRNVASNNIVVPQTDSDGTLKLKEWTLASDENKTRLFLDNAYKEITLGSYIVVHNTLDLAPESRGPGRSGLVSNEVELAQLETEVELAQLESEVELAQLEAESIGNGGSVNIDPSLSSEPQVYQVKDVVLRSRSAYGLSGKTTQITVANLWWNANSSNFEKTVRNAVVYAQSEQLTLATIPIPNSVSGDIITLNGFYLGLYPGQIAILTGERADLPGVINSEQITIKTITIQSGYTQITLQKELTYPHVRNTVTINANIAPATHGETVEEILGSGDASQPYQSFTLSQSPLTYVSSDATPSGALSTLKIRVNDLLWQETSMLYGQKSSDRIYVTRQTEDGRTLVEFGNGKTGARLPTGLNNLQANYRKGIGFAGNVRANQLTSLMSRPLGLKEVTNPLPASGGQDGETLSDSRQNAPLTVLTLDRVVSLQDYEDFAHAFGGIAKALATWTWMGQQRGVFVTVAGPQGATVEADLIEKLVEQFHRSGDPHILVRVQSYQKALFKLAGGIKVDPDFQSQLVLDAVRQALTEAFSFDSRAFGQGVALSEVLAVIQSVPGVIYVDLDVLERDGLTIDGLQAPLPAAVPLPNEANFSAAELLTLDPASLDDLGELP